MRRAWRPALPGLAWLGLWFGVPLLLVAAYSLMHQGLYGGVEPGVTLEHYARLLDPLYLGIIARTVVLSLAATLLALLIGFPMAYVIAGSGRWRRLLLFLVVLPFWTSFLVRTYAMIFLLRDSGLINTLLLDLGVIHAP
ncbi:MAG TPA: hypothetical protein VFI13_02875, partial [Gemmatimonadales bacterium]|nr:hypothetical protein [Gemmatimonadales bacterium]